jgi:7-keto-8-aminopelargonate synthetase-like enzyme
MFTNTKSGPPPATGQGETPIPEPPNAMTGSMLQFARQGGVSLEQRTAPFWAWIEERRRNGVWPYFRVLDGQVGRHVSIANEWGETQGACINFGSQDYLGLAQAEDTRNAVREAVAEFGVHSAGSPALCGRTRPLLALERRIADLFHREAAVVFPTGWAAGFSAIAGVVRREDSVLMDERSHNCLQEGARHATSRVAMFAHNDLGQLEELLKSSRSQDARSGLFVVVESLYSMDSDGPDLPRVLALCREYDAISIVDVAHDLGAMGRRGLGLLELIDLNEGPDLIMGSFSKTFAANGGFIACSQAVRTYLGCYSAALSFSNAISPMQTAVVNHTFATVFSAKGEDLREALASNVDSLRAAMEQHNLRVGGYASPICPVYVGAEPLARLTARGLVREGLIANLVEFPAVPRGQARFRFQVMASHSPEQIQQAAVIMARVRAEADSIQTNS